MFLSAFLAVATVQAAPQPAAKLRLWDGPAPAAWKKAGVPVHFEPYATGGHNAFSLQKAGATGKDWADKFLVWINVNPALTIAKPVVK